MRSIPQAAIDLVKTSEGFRAEVNLDPVGYDEIGYGHKLTAGDPMWAAGPINEAEAETLAMTDLKKAAQGLESTLGGTIVETLTEGQWAALLDFVFNLGIGAFAKSTLCRLIRLGQMQAAASEFGRWIHAGDPPEVLPGLVKRRAAETALWKS